MEDYKEKIVKYFDQVAPAYGVRHGADMPGGHYGFGELYKGILAADFERGMNVLEIGCGNGASSEMLASYGVNLLATDISEGMIKVASSRNIPTARFRQLDAMTISAEKNLGLFDVIIAFNAFAYLPNKAKFLRDARAFLKPRGKIIVLDMNARCPVYPISAMIGRLDMGEWWKTIKEMTRANLMLQFANAGYDVQEIRTLNFVPHATNGAVFQVLKTMNPILNKTPVLNRFAMRVLVRALKDS